MYSMADILHWYFWGTGKDQNLHMHFYAEPGVGMAPGWFLEKGGQYFLVFFGPLIVVGGLGSLWSGPEAPHAGPGAEMQPGWFLQIGGNYLSASALFHSQLFLLCIVQRTKHTALCYFLSPAASAWGDTCIFVNPAWPNIGVLWRKSCVTGQSLRSKLTIWG